MLRRLCKRVLGCRPTHSMIYLLYCGCDSAKGRITSSLLDIAEEVLEVILSLFKKMNVCFSQLTVVDMDIEWIDNVSNDNCLWFIFNSIYCSTYS